MHHANLGCNYADSQIISSTVPLSVEKVDFEQYIYAGAECVLAYYPHILAQEGQFRFAYMFRFRNNYVIPLNDDMRYDLCQKVYGQQGDRLPAWQACDADYPMRHNGVVNPPPNNPPPPQTPSCPANGHWSPKDGKCNCDGDLQWNNGQCIYQKCPQNGHREVGQDKCICNDGWYWWTSQCFKCPKHSHVTGGGNYACDNGFTWLNGECVSTNCPRHSQLLGCRTSQVCLQRWLSRTQWSVLQRCAATTYLG